MKKGWFSSLDQDKQLLVVLVILGLFIWLFFGGSGSSSSGGGSRKCRYCGQSTNYYCSNHMQWECPSCHSRRN